jgi:glycosyltransferase involved in cell wall biosynthesis
MRIAVFTDYFFPELGGIQDSIAITAASLARRGHFVDIYAPRYGEADYRRGGATAREPDLGPGVRVHRRASLPFPSSTTQSRAALPSPLGWAALSGAARPDVIHVHSFFGIGLEALANAAWLGIPTIGTNHTTIAGFAPHIPVSADRAGAYVLWFYNRCDYVTAPSASVFAELGAARLLRPHQVISNPIDTALFRPAPAGPRDALRARFGLAGPTITYAGRLGAEKNIEVLLHAIARLRDMGVTAELAIAGHGSHLSVLQTLASDLGIASRVKFLGTLPHADLAKLLQISDTFVIMSTSETQSMVLLQAMACGIPVIAAASRALPEFVGPANGLLVDPHDPVALAAALADLLAAPARRRHLGEGGRTLAERYNVETVTDAWEVLYATVLPRRSAA